MDRNPGHRRLCRARAAMAVDGAAAAGAQDFARSARHDANRGGLPDVEFVDVRPGPQREAAGHGLAAWRRHGLWVGQSGPLRRNQFGAAMWSSSVSIIGSMSSVFSTWPILAGGPTHTRAMPGCSISLRHCAGCTTISTDLAAIPAT